MEVSLPASCKKITQLAGLALNTQAGIALGLAREVAVEFPSLGDAFSTMEISVIVINEVALKLAYRLGVPRLIIRPNMLTNTQVYSELGALIVDSASAKVNLLEKAVGAPQNTLMLLR